MKIKKDELLKALEIVKPGLASKEIIEQSTHFAFIKDRVVTYNDEISISHSVPGMDVNGVIQADELYKLVGKLKRDEIDLEVTENELIITVGKAQAGLRLQTEIKLPLSEIDRQEKWKPLPEKFLEAVRFAIGSCSNDMSRPKTTCVHVSSTYAEGSDGYRISKYMVKNIPVENLLVPASSMKEMLKIKPTEITVGHSWVHFRAGETMLSCRVIAEEYFDTQPHLKIEGAQEIVFPQNIYELLDRAAVFSKRDHFLDESVGIELTQKRIKVRGESLVGWFEEETITKYSGPEIKFDITPTLLKDILKMEGRCGVSSNKIKFTGEDWEYVALLKNQK